MSYNNPYLNSFGNSSKGILSDWGHAAKLFTNENLKFAPKHKFLYHTTFFLSDAARSFAPELDEFKDRLGMLVKNSDLPSYTANVETKNKYNRKKKIQTAIEYSPISMELHDDNYGITTFLLESYFAYYFADTRNDKKAYVKNPYSSSAISEFRYGLDSVIDPKAFFDKIEIAQLSRGYYNLYTLVNPIITDWSHDSVDYSAGGETMTNSITIEYETVFYQRGTVEVGQGGEPTNFGREDVYDVTPSSLSGSLPNGNRMQAQGTLNPPAPQTTDNRPDRLDVQTSPERNSPPQDTTTTTASETDVEQPEQQPESQSEPTQEEIQTKAKWNYIRQNAPTSDPEKFSEAGREWENLPPEEKEPFLSKAEQQLQP
jgi:hypothetical protein